MGFHPSRNARIFGNRIVLAGLVVGSVFAFLIGVHGATQAQIRTRLALESIEWPTTTGQVIDSEVESLHMGVVAGGEVTVYRFRVQYEYTVDGNSYVSDRITFDDIEDSRRKAKSLASKYPFAKIISVSYNPNNPEESVLEPGEPPPDWTHWLFFFILSAALGASALFWLRKDERMQAK